MKDGEKECTKVKKLRNERGKERLHESEKSRMKEGEKEYTKVKKLRNEGGREKYTKEKN